MRAREQDLFNEIKSKLESFEVPLPGVAQRQMKVCLIEQIIDSIRRIKYIESLNTAKLSPDRANPASVIFDPLRAAAFLNSNGRYEEACWIVFLGTHFGKNLKTGWELVRNFYFGDHSTSPWTWEYTISNLYLMPEWLESNLERLLATGAFSNHRKYQSLDPKKKASTLFTIESYVNWVLAVGSHRNRFSEFPDNLSETPGARFNYLYKEMGAVIGFGRLGKFDYLTMIGKLKLADIEPESPYITNATGPLLGAKLLFGPHYSKKQLEGLVISLGISFGYFYSMQILEDALCNWQKSPEVFIHFKG